MKRKSWLVTNSVIIFAFLLLVWERLVKFTHLPTYILPGPLAVASAARDRFPSLLNSLWITTIEASGGLVASIIVGVIIAMIFAQWRWLRQLSIHTPFFCRRFPLLLLLH